MTQPGGVEDEFHVSSQPDVLKTGESEMISSTRLAFNHLLFREPFPYASYSFSVSNEHFYQMTRFFPTDSNIFLESLEATVHAKVQHLLKGEVFQISSWFKEYILWTMLLKI